MKVTTVTASTPKLQEFFDAWARLDQRHETARTDNNLSMQGKREAFTRIDNDRQRLKADMFQAVVSVFDALKRDYLANKKARGAAIEKSLSRWESLSGAITTETERVKNLLQRGTPVPQLQAAWEAAKDSGAMIRAWYLAMSGSDRTGGDFNSLRVKVNAEYDALHNDIPDMQAANDKGAAITGRGVSLRDDIIAFMTLLSANGGDVFDPSGAARDLQNMLMRLRVTNSMKNGTMFTTLEIVDSPQDELEKLVIQDSTFNGQVFAPAK